MDQPINIDDTDVAIVGAGPYGLSLAAQLRARGVTFRIFGSPMTFWLGMPAGINLKSLAFATNIYVPERGHTFPEWCRARNLEDLEPCTMKAFAEYGLWMKDRFVADVEPYEVTNVSQLANGFEVMVAGRWPVRARRVALATGLSYFAKVPPLLRGLPQELVSHTFHLSDYSIFRRKEVAVIGGGASAIEAGALVHEAGGSARVLVREPIAVFHNRTPRVRPLLERIREPITVLGAGRKNWILQEIPLALHFVPEARRIRFVRGYLGPASPWWIKDRIDGKVPIHVSTEVVGVRATDGRVQLTLAAGNGANGTRELEVDHVIAGTGYEVDVASLPYLAPQLRARIRTTERAPALSMYFESSVKGLYFLGPAVAMSFGPLFRFVAGAKFATPTVARHLAGPMGEVKRAVRRWGLSFARSA